VIAIDTSHRPLIVVELIDEITLDDVETQRRAYVELHAPAQRFAMIVDTRRARMPSAPIRRALGDLGNAFGEATKRDVIAVVIILGNKLMVGAFHAVKWFIPRHVDMQPASTAAEAFAYATERAAAEQLAMPTSLAVLARRLDTRGPPTTG
jgi:hypothetical protein